ncbi:MAG: hypothetical protein JSV24_03540, partial [Bacteroidales bacterium]
TESNSGAYNRKMTEPSCSTSGDLTWQVAFRQEKNKRVVPNNVSKNRDFGKLLNFKTVIFCSFS